MAREPAEELSLLVAAAEEAGRVAMSYFRGLVEQWEKPGLGPVSAADLAADEVIRARLAAARPDYGWLSEESEGAHDRDTRARIFIVDPIDGTRAFLAGDSGWGTALAVAEHGRVIAGVMHLPARGETYTASRGGGARRNRDTIRVSARRDLAGARVLAASRQLRPELWAGGVPPVEAHFRPSLAWRLCLVAEGAFDAMITLRDAYEWDIAAGSLIAAEAGARVTDREGAEPLFNRHPARVAGLIVAPPVLHEQIMAHLHPGH